MSNFSIENDSKVAAIEKHLSANNYLSEGPLPDASDAQIFFDLAGNAPNKEKYPNFFFWWANLSVFAEPVLKSWLEKKAASKPEAKKAEKGGDDVDLFGEDEDGAKKMEELKANKAAESKKKSESKKEVVAKTIVIFDVKVFDTQQDLNALAQKIMDLQIEGLQWRTEYQLVKVAYGIQALRIGCTVEDEKVSVEEDILEKIQSWEDEVQSCDVVSMQKV